MGISTVDQYCSEMMDSRTVPIARRSIHTAGCCVPCALGISLEDEGDDCVRFLLLLATVI